MTSQIRRSPGAACAQPQATLSYGQQFGPYIITGFAGSGATSYVYKARRRDRYEPVAIKVLHPHLVADPTKRLKFYQEARIMMRMQHPNVARFLEIIEEDDTLAFVMEYIDGVTLERFRSLHSEYLDEATLGCIFVDVLRGLTAAHRQGVVHRDMKPANVMITQIEGRYTSKIIDFGVARFLDEPLSETERNKIVGTAAYISPEEVVDPDGVCLASDLYSLGVMLYEAACGQRPFEGLEVRELMDAHARRAPQRPRQVNPGLSGGFEAVIMRTLEKQPDSRFGSAAEMIGAIERALQGAYQLAETPLPTLENEVTAEWSRAVQEVEIQARRRGIGAWLRRCVEAAVSKMGSEASRAEPEHFAQRPADALMPFR
ncbi:hypothetical protein DL240_04180 [Lujinxingia litoralis]|uniref:Protein kinase domain-containing protein n=1 Tax=Lujinxingia litoralis TaxID=2211119 RepID=A0A328C9V6_9DELT|nr:serine/threonine-protein kinase [Lujinxingia litoralis]RAL25417.1 hypothetical protein DL240_04180 [Lujinxingia litoralis]